MARASRVVMGREAWLRAVTWVPAGNQGDVSGHRWPEVRKGPLSGLAAECRCRGWGACSVSSASLDTGPPYGECSHISEKWLLLRSPRGCPDPGPPGSERELHLFPGPGGLDEAGSDTSPCPRERSHTSRLIRPANKGTRPIQPRPSATPRGALALFPSVEWLQR